MKKLPFHLLFCLLSFSSLAQDDITTELYNAYDAQEFDLIIANHSAKADEYPAKAVYFIAMAYYMKADDKNVLKFMDLSIKKDKTDPDAYFIKGMTYNYMGLFSKAIECYDKAIDIDSSNSNYFSGLGDAYFNLGKYDKALSAYQEATQKDNPIDRPFTMIPQIYAELNQAEKALEAFYVSKESISKESDSYLNALYNIGLYEFLQKEYDKSESAYKELIELAPNDYQSYAKLIQVYYGKKEYEKAAPFRALLYQAYESGKLSDNLKSKFCFDQFTWNDKLILVYERFAVKEGELYYKHIFYIPNEKGETDYTIQTENSPISQEMGGTKYLLGMDKAGTHSTFSYGFNENFNYDDLKKAVILVLDEKVKAGISSKPTKKSK